MQPPSQLYFMDCDYFYKIAKDGYSKACQGVPFQRQDDAIVSILFSAFALEAFINELLAFAKSEKESGVNEPYIDKLIEAIRDPDSSSGVYKKNTQEKFLLASKALESEFDKGKNPYQDFADLFKLRDCLVHLKPEDRIEPQEDGTMKYLGRKLTASLRSKDILQEHTTINSITLLVGTAKAARWACITASVMVQTILEKIPPSSSSTAYDIIAYYKHGFEFP